VVGKVCKWHKVAAKAARKDYRQCPAVLRCSDACPETPDLPCRSQRRQVRKDPCSKLSVGGLPGGGIWHSLLRKRGNPGTPVRLLEATQPLPCGATPPQMSRKALACQGGRHLLLGFKKVAQTRNVRVEPRNRLGAKEQLAGHAQDGAVGTQRSGTKEAAPSEPAWTPDETSVPTVTLQQRLQSTLLGQGEAQEQAHHEKLHFRRVEVFSGRPHGMEEAKKAERARELEEKKARLEAYRTKRRLDKLPDKEEAAVAAAPATQVTAAAPAPNVEALLASVLAAPAANAVPEAAQPVAAPVTVEREAVAVALAVRRGAAGAEAAPREVETYVRTTQTDASAADERSESNQTPVSEVAPSPTPSVEETAEAAAAREEREAALKAKAERQAAAVAEAERRRWREDAGLAAAAERAGERTERWLRASEGSGRDPLWDPRRAAESGGAAGGGESAGAGEPVAILRPGDNELGAVAALAGSPHAAELCLAVHSGNWGYMFGLVLFSC
jgi:hypothetical protein